MEPLNYLRELKQQYKFTANNPEAYEVETKLIEIASISKKFILPANAEFLQIDDKKNNDLFRDLCANRDGIRLPFPNIVFEFKFNSVKIIFLISEQESQTIESEKFFCLSIFFNDNGIWTVPWIVTYVRFDSYAGTHILYKDLKRNQLHDSDSEEGSKLADGILPFIYVLIRFLVAISCSNVTHDPVCSAKKEKYKSSKTNPYGFDEYRTIVVKNNYQAHSSSGHSGIHRSPREHLRRGHVRRLSDGKNIWINSMVVNSGTRGKITSDYDLRRLAA